MVRGEGMPEIKIEVQEELSVPSNSDDCPLACGSVWENV
jgi:hypothetical protein